MSPAWADQYSLATLRHALQLAYEQQRDPAHIFDHDWHAAQRKRIADISTAIQARLLEDGQ